MDKVVLVHVLEARDHLLTQHADSLQSELATAVLEEIFERVTKQLHHHGLVVALNAIPEDLRDALSTTQKPV